MSWNGGCTHTDQTGPYCSICKKCRHYNQHKIICSDCNGLTGDHFTQNPPSPVLAPDQQRHNNTFQLECDVWDPAAVERLEFLKRGQFEYALPGYSRHDTIAEYRKKYGMTQGVHMYIRHRDQWLRHRAELRKTLARILAQNQAASESPAPDNEVEPDSMPKDTSEKLIEGSSLSGLPSSTNYMEQSPEASTEQGNSESSSTPEESSSVQSYHEHWSEDVMELFGVFADGTTNEAQGMDIADLFTDDAVETHSSTESQSQQQVSSTKLALPAKSVTAHVENPFRRPVMGPIPLPFPPLPSLQLFPVAQAAVSSSSGNSTKSSAKKSTVTTDKPAPKRKRATPAKKTNAEAQLADGEAPANQKRGRKPKAPIAPVMPEASLIPAVSVIPMMPLPRQNGAPLKKELAGTEFQPIVVD